MEYIAAYNDYQTARSKVCVSIQCAFCVPSRQIRFSRVMFSVCADEHI